VQEIVQNCGELIAFVINKVAQERNRKVEQSAKKVPAGSLKVVNFETQITDAEYEFIALSCKTATPFKDVVTDAHTRSSRATPTKNSQFITYQILPCFVAY
jgi:CO dehydrogenase nickel-insertion accessory protein CooC1